MNRHKYDSVARRRDQHSHHRASRPIYVNVLRVESPSFRLRRNEKSGRSGDISIAFYYKVILPVPGLLQGLFVELVLTDDDADVPSVMIVNAHEQLP